MKIPQLKITKFEGAALDWFWFWNEFETEIDQVQISAMSNFSYLKECLAPKIRFFFCINYIIHCKIKKDNHQVHKIVRVPRNKINPKKIRLKIYK